jgi:flavin-dependent dehydrogenase
LIDIAVVGGGPAGLAVAIEAVRRGLSATVIERHTGPVDKACGEGILPGGLARLAALGIDPAGMPFHGIRYVSGDVVAEADFVEGPGRGVRRTVLSAALQGRADALGVDRWTTTEATGFVQDADGVTLATSSGPLRARWLVAADGLHSRMRTAAGFAVALGARRRLGIRRHFHVTPWTRHVEVWWADGVEAYVTPVAEDQVGVAFLWSRGKGDHATFLTRFPALAARLGEPASTVRGAGPFDVRVRGQVRGRVLLAGDAAGYSDAITGEGIALAMDGAERLVDAIVAGTPERWTHDFHALSARPARLTRMLLGLTARPWIRHRIVRALAASPRGFQAFLALNSGAWSPLRALPGAATVGFRLLTG